MPGAALAAEAPVVEVQELLDMSADQRRRLGRGEILSYPVTENSERELAVGLAMFVPAPPAQLADLLAAGRLIAIDATIAESGLVPDEPPAAPVGPRFSASEREEAEGLLDATPGTRFNLSPAEIEALRALGTSSGGSARAALADVASDAYRRLLLQRLQAYRHGGLAAIVPYARTGGAVTDPAIDLRLAAADADRLARRGSGLREALLRYPADQPSQAIHRFHWVKRRVQRRPHLSLMHRIVVEGPGPFLHVERYFYVGHTYNSTAIVTSALPYQDGTLIFSVSRVSTDEILGLGSQVKRTFGRGQLRDEMRNRLERLRALFSSRPSAPVESP